MTTNLTIERRAIAELREDPHNARRHDGANLAAIRASLTRFGQQKPIVIDATGQVVAGNGTLAAARALGWVDVAVVVTDLVGPAARAYALADNRTAELADWDVERLRADLAAVEMPDIDAMFEGLDLGGDDVAPSEVDAEPKIEIADELAERWGTKQSQVWELGAHRLACGSSSDQDLLARLLGDEKASVVFTDPPYGVAIAAKNRAINAIDQGKGGRVEVDIVDDALSPEELRQRLLPAFTAIRTRVMAPDCTVFVTAPQGGDLGMMMMMMQDAGLPARHVLIWKKSAPTFSMGRLDYDYKHEPILLTWGKSHKRPMRGQHRTSVWEIAKPRSSKEHPTMKPVELVVNAILNHSDADDIVFDGFLGSGTTLLACERTRTRCRGVEISPGYVAVALQRWADATGGVPVLL